MTLDEAITCAKEISSRHFNDMVYCIKCSEIHGQIAEWLEDYKCIKRWKSDIMDSFCKYDVNSFEELVTNVRNKAIDDFVTKIKKYMETTEQATYIDEINNGNDNYSSMTIYDYVDDLAEELKVGVYSE